MKYILLLLALFTSTGYCWDQPQPLPIQNCEAKAPFGFPQTNREGIAICRTGYLTYNDYYAKLPMWVSYTLYPEYALGCVPRSNAFAADASLQKGMRAELNDYKGSGYDIGHLVPAADMSRFDDTERESFLLSNMAPQKASLNRGPWKLLETNVRGWTTQLGHPFVVYAGPLYGPGDKVIGLNKVVVPHAFFKIVIDKMTGQTAGFIFPHMGNIVKELPHNRAPLAQIEQLSGIKFAYPDNVSELPRDVLWPMDYKQLIKDKELSCSPGKQE